LQLLVSNSLSQHKLRGSRTLSASKISGGEILLADFIQRQYRRMTDRASLKQKSRLEHTKEVFLPGFIFSYCLFPPFARSKFREVLKPKMTNACKAGFLLGACFVEQLDL